MIKRQYHCLVAGLQDITLDIHKLIYNSTAFKEELKAQLHASDYSLVEWLFLPIDNVNLLNLLEKNQQSFIEGGNYSKEQLEDDIREPNSLPAFMQSFITAYKSKEPIYPGLSPENELTTLFYDAALAVRNNFLRDWFRFELTLRNMLTAHIGRRHGISIEYQIIGTDEISESIRRSQARDFGLGADIDFIDQVADMARIEDVQDREKAIDEFKWDYLEEATFFHYFTIERILGYVIKLGMVERWLAIDKEYGNEMFRKLLKELQSSYKLPETFTEK